MDTRFDYGENDEWTVASASTVTVYFKEGTDSATSRYINPSARNDGSSRSSYGLVFRPSATCQILGIGNKTFKNPMTITTSGLTIVRDRIAPFNKMIVKTLSANTDIKLWVF